MPKRRLGGCAAIHPHAGHSHTSCTHAHLSLLGLVLVPLPCSPSCVHGKIFVQSVGKGRPSCPAEMRSGVSPLSSLRPKQKIWKKCGAEPWFSVVQRFLFGRRTIYKWSPAYRQRAGAEQAGRCCATYIAPTKVRELNEPPRTSFHVPTEIRHHGSNRKRTKSRFETSIVDVGTILGDVIARRRDATVSADLVVIYSPGMNSHERS